MQNRINWLSGVRILGLCLALLAIAGCDNPLATSGGDSEEDSVLAAGEDAGTGNGSADDSSSSDDPPERVVALDPGRAEIRGAAQNRCWDGECYWVVWCGHKICDGSWTWTFPSSGDYQITWEGVKEKCAGSPAYEVRINGRTVTDGRVPRHGSCSGCDGSGRFVDRELGTFEIEKGDAVTLWVENHFACGIEGPGAYAAHDSLRADLQ